MEAILQAEHLTKTYGEGETAVHALRGVSLAVQQGEVLAIVGRSGSGKSTLLQLLGALDRPTGGTVRLTGEDVFALSDEAIAAVRRRKLGFVFQSFHLLPEYTVRDNILMPLYLDGQKPNEAYLSKIASTLDISEKLSKQPHQLSGGQQQRVAIARALIASPAVILADEPTGNLDKANGEQVFALLQAAARSFGQTVVFVTHDDALAARADRAIVLSDGKII